MEEPGIFARLTLRNGATGTVTRLFGTNVVHLRGTAMSA